MRIFKNLSHKLELTVTDLLGNYILGLVINYEVIKCSDDSIISSGTMSEIDSVYTKEITISNVGEYRIKYITPEGYENGFENLIVDDYDNYKGSGGGGLTVEQDAILRRICGLSQENYRVINPVYTTKNNQPCMTSAVIRIYPTASDCNSDTNKIAEYNIEATFDTQARMTGYKVVKE
jgi:hypothetical protein